METIINFLSHIIRICMEKRERKGGAGMKIRSFFYVKFHPGKVFSAILDISKATESCTLSHSQSESPPNPSTSE